MNRHYKNLLEKKEIVLSELRFQFNKFLKIKACMIEKRIRNEIEKKKEMRKISNNEKKRVFYLYNFLCELSVINFFKRKK